MSKLVKVPLFGTTPPRAVTINAAATEGAVIGVNVRNPDGSLFVPIATPADTKNPVTVWQRIMYVPPNVVALAEATGTGLFAVTGPGTGAFRTITAGDGIDVADGDGVSGDPIVSHADTSLVTDIAAEFTGSTVPWQISITFDQFGHVLSRTITGRQLAHNETASLQGGGPGDYYHLTQAEAASVPTALQRDGSVIATGDLTFSHGDMRIQPNTSDGADTAVSRLLGGGGASTGRGAIVSAFGNEHASQPGRLLLQSGVGANVVLASSGAVRPLNDNATALAEASARLTEVWAVDGTINTSDEREKTPLRGMTQAEIACAVDLSQLPCIFKWLSAVDEKGDAARWHVSPGAQSVIAVMERHGLDPFAYGFVCYDHWDEQPELWDEWPEQRDEDGNVVREAGRDLVQPYRAAGDRYSLRPSELAWFVIRGQAARQDALEARIAALEG